MDGHDSSTYAGAYAIFFAMGFAHVVDQHAHLGAVTDRGRYGLTRADVKVFVDYIFARCCGCKPSYDGKFLKIQAVKNEKNGNYFECLKASDRLEWLATELYNRHKLGL